MKIKSRHVVWTIFALFVIAYALWCWLGPQTEEQIEAGGRFAAVGFLVLIVLLIGTWFEKRRERRR